MDETNTKIDIKEIYKKRICYFFILFIFLFFFITPCVYQKDNLYGKLLLTLFELSIVVVFYTSFLMCLYLKINFPTLSTCFCLYTLAILYLFWGSYSPNFSLTNFSYLHELKHEAMARYDLIAFVSFLTFIFLLIPCVYIKPLKKIGMTYLIHIVFLFTFYLTLSNLTNLHKFESKKTYIDFYKNCFSTSSYFVNVKKNAKEIINIFL